MSKIIVITGPTGVGKTKLSIELAKKYNAIIINADSMQIYKELDIGTAKIKEDEKENIPHYLFDIKDVTEDYTIYNYQKDVRNLLEINKDRTIILVGGTALYIKAVLYDYEFKEEINHHDFTNYSTEQLYNKLTKLDKNIKIDKNNRRRVERALEYILNNKESINTNNKGNRLLYDTVFIGLTTDRKKLYSIIDQRVDKMLDEGLLQEVKKFYDNKVYTKPLINGIGYKELYKYFNNEITKERAIELIKRNSRRYAKRQYTFLNNQFDNIKWFNVNFQNFNITIEEVIKYINKNKKTDLLI